MEDGTREGEENGSHIIKMAAISFLRLSIHLDVLEMHTQRPKKKKFKRKPIPGAG